MYSNCVAAVFLILTVVGLHLRSFKQSTHSPQWCFVSCATVVTFRPGLEEMGILLANRDIPAAITGPEEGYPSILGNTFSCGLALIYHKTISVGRKTVRASYPSSGSRDPLPLENSAFVNILAIGICGYERVYAYNVRVSENCLR